jgi:hypothetical protein
MTISRVVSCGFIRSFPRMTGSGTARLVACVRAASDSEARHSLAFVFTMQIRTSERTLQTEHVFGHIGQDQVGGDRRNLI